MSRINRGDGGNATAIGAALTAQLMAATSNSATRELDYQANFAIRNLVPPMEEALRLHYGGFLSQPMLAKVFGWHGANLLGSLVTGDEVGRIWQTLIAQKRPEFDVDLLRRLMWRGTPGARDQLTLALQKLGFRGSNHPEWFVNWTEQLPEGTLLDWYFKTTTTRTEMLRLLQQYGYSEADAGKLLDAADRWPDLALTMRLLNLGVIDASAMADYVRGLGYVEPTVADAIKKTRWTPPDISLIATSGVRNTWNDIFAAKWGLDDDRPTQYTEWAKRLGYQYSAGTDAYGTAPQQAQAGHTAPDANSAAMFTWDKAIWRQSWRVPDLAMLAEIVHRFRGNPDVPATWSQPGYPPLRQDEIWDVLRANGLPTLARNYWGRLVYRPIDLRHAKIMVEFGGWGLGEVTGALQDNGFSPVDAPKLAMAIVNSVYKPGASMITALAQQTARRIVKDIEAAYETGTLTEDAALEQLVAQAVPADLAATLLAAVDIEANTDLAKQLIARTKSEAYSGQISFPQASARLLQFGLAGPRVAKLIQVWTAGFNAKRRQLATNDILRLLRKGLLTRAAAISRLSTLGWTQPDEILLLAEVSGEVKKDNAAAVKALETAAKSQRSAILTTVNRMAATANKLLSRLKSLEPVASIMDWYKDGLWTESQVRDRMHLYGYGDDTIDTMLLAKLGLASGAPIPETAPAKGS